MVLAATAVVLGVSALLGWSAPRLLRGAHPAVATWAVSAAAAIGAMCCAFAVGVPVAAAVGTLPAVARLGSWSPAALRHASGVGAAEGVLLTAVVGASAIGAARSVLELTRARLRTSRAVRLLGGTRGELVIVDTLQPTAFAVTGGGGRVVVSRSLLGALDPGEQHCVVAHERAHLRHHHQIHRALVGLAVAVNPMLRPLARAVMLSTERWADEAAAAEVDRATAARAIVRAAMASAGSAATPAMGLAIDDVDTRVRALLHPADRSRLRGLWTMGLLVVALLGATRTSKQAGERSFEHAMHAAASAPAT